MAPRLPERVDPPLPEKVAHAYIVVVREDGTRVGIDIPLEDQSPLLTGFVIDNAVNYDDRPMWESVQRPLRYLDRTTTFTVTTKGEWTMYTPTAEETPPDAPQIEAAPAALPPSLP